MKRSLSASDLDSSAAHWTALLKMIVLAATLLYLAGLSPYLQGGGDDVYYVAVAKSIVEGEGFSSGHIAGSPPDVHHTPLFPVLLAGLYYFSPNNYVLFKLISLASGLVCICLVFKLSSEYVSPGRALLVSLLFALNPLVFQLSHAILTELLFTSFSIAALLCLERYDESGTDFNSAFWGSILFASAAYYTRSMGVPLLITAVLYFLVRRKFKRALLIGGSIFLLASPWLLRGILLGPSSELQVVYAPFFFAQDPTDPHSPTITLADLVIRMLRKGGGYLGRDVPALMAFPNFFGSISLTFFEPLFFLKLALGLLISVPMLLGYLKCLRERRLLISMYVPLYFIPLLTCSFSSPRLLVPISPLLLIFFVEGVETVFGSRWLHRVVAAMVVIALLSDALELYKAHTLEMPTRGDKLLVEWMDENSPADAVLLNGPIGTLYLHTGRRGVPLWGKLTQQEILDRIRKYGVDYVAFYPGGDYGQDRATAQTAQNLKRLIDDRVGEFVLVYEKEGVALYSVQLR